MTRGIAALQLRHHPKERLAVPDTLSCVTILLSYAFVLCKATFEVDF